MNQPYSQPPRFSPSGLATGAILAVIVAMGLSVAFNTDPAQAKPGIHLVHAAAAHRA